MSTQKDSRSTESDAGATRGPSEAPGGDVGAGKGRRDVVGRTGIYPASGPLPEGEAEVLTPGDINEGHTGKRHHDLPARLEDVRNVERLPRKGDELDDMGDTPTD